jgi:hypothetical protein
MANKTLTNHGTEKKKKKSLDHVALLNVFVSTPTFDAYDLVSALYHLPTLGFALFSLGMYFPESLRFSCGQRSILLC